MQVLLSAAAEQDLEDIALYIAQDNPSRALTFTDELQAKAESLGHSPRKGAERFHVLPGLKLLPHGNYNIYYIVGDNAVRILRFLHSARDIKTDDFA